jgi:hypothetical protein
MDDGRRDDENSGGLRVAEIKSRGIAIMDSPVLANRRLTRL